LDKGNYESMAGRLWLIGSVRADKPTVS